MKPKDGYFEVAETFGCEIQINIGYLAISLIHILVAVFCSSALWKSHKSQVAYL
jgi:hypothetical protein